jgi:hypothetical protein
MILQLTDYQRHIWIIVITGSILLSPWFIMYSLAGKSGSLKVELKCNKSI